MLVIQNTNLNTNKVELYHKKRCFVRAKYHLIRGKKKIPSKYKTDSELYNAFSNQIISLRKKYSVKYL